MAAAEPAPPLPVSPSEAPFRALDNVEGPHVDLGIVPFRPMVVTPDEEHLFAVNSHGSLVVHYDRSLTLQHLYQVPWGPVSVGHWYPEGEGGLGELLVATRGTWALTRLDPATGEIGGILPLPAEPADLLIDPARRRAYVACAGADLVAVVDLDTFDAGGVTLVPIPSKQPAFMAFEGDAVLVAPQLSGNNTTVDKGDLLLDAGDGDVLDLSLFDSQLADEDLFRIDPDDLSVEAVSVGAGAVLFAHGINPATGDHWQLGTDAHNKGPFGEPLLVGDFVEDRITVTHLPPAGASAEPGHGFIPLDPAGGALGEAIGQPYALDFSADGEAFVTGLLTNNVARLGPDGSVKAVLPTCSIPRGVKVVDSFGAPGILLVYCWGDNTIEGWNVQGEAPFVGFTLSVGFDPTPPLAKEGRALFFSGERSDQGNASCASCHVEGATDMLAWYLGEPPFDDKGPLVTQTLKGIEGLAPYHWRGERADLDDFNVAFPALLGGEPLDDAQLAAFKAYVFGLQNPANPQEDRRRVVSADVDDFAGPVGVDPDGVRGQDLYFDQVVAAGRSCNGCHTLPTGTSNDVFNDEAGHLLQPKRSHFKVAPFHALWRKEQPTRTTLDVGDGPYQVPTLGAGLSVAGLAPSLFDFVNLPAFALDPQGVADVASFVHQVDSGLAPAVHRAVLLARETAAEAGPELMTYLLPQAQARHCDLAAVGTAQTASGPALRAYAWHRDDGLFHPDTAGTPALTPQQLIQRAASGRLRLVVMGAPVGMGPSLSADVDADGLANFDEVKAGLDPFLPDSDGDGVWDGPEVAGGSDPKDPDSLPADGAGPILSDVRVVYVTSRVAKLAFETDEPAQARVIYTSSAGEVGEAVGAQVGRNHTVFLRHLRSGESYSVVVAAVDGLGNRSQQALADPLTTLGPLTPDDVIAGDLTFDEALHEGGALSGELSALALTKAGAPAPDLFLAVDAYVNGEDRGVFFQASASGADGWTHLPVTLGGLTPGDEIRLVIFSLYGFSPAGELVTTRWSFPDTAPAKRELSLTY